MSLDTAGSLLNKIMVPILVLAIAWMGSSVIAHGTDIAQLKERSMSRQEYMQLQSDIATLKATLDGNASLLEQVLQTNRIMIERMPHP